MFFMHTLIAFSDERSSYATCLFALPIVTNRRIALTFAECFVDHVGRDFFGDFAGHVAWQRWTSRMASISLVRRLLLSRQPAAPAFNTRTARASPLQVVSTMVLRKPSDL